MRHANFAYSQPANDSAGVRLSLSVFADRAQVRGTMRDDAEAAGFRVVEETDLTGLIEGDVRPLGEVVLLDCPVVSGSTYAALARLDVRAAHSGASIIVSTGIDALDEVFACMDQSLPQILVDPGRAERVIALGRVLAKVSDLRVRELGEEDRLLLLRLSEQVEQVAQRLDRLGGVSAAPFIGGEDSAFRFESPKRGFSGDGEDGGGRLSRALRPPLPDPRLVRRIVLQRQLRARFFDGELFADPAWDILLDLTAARVEHKRVSVTSLCIASGVPPTTALRWIGQLIDAGLLERVEDDADRRRAFIALTDMAADGMARYFAELGRHAGKLV